MSAPASVLRIQNLISLSVSHIALNPVITASLLYILTKGPPQIRNHLFNRFESLRDPQRLAKILKALKGLLALGLLGTINQQFNKVALNAGRWTKEKKRWNLSQEIAVVTGGCSGIGELVVRGLSKKGVTVAVLDIQQLPPSLQGCTSIQLFGENMLIIGPDANIKFFACDIANPEAVNSTAEKIRSTLGAPSILINNAGIGAAHTILGTSDEWLRKIFDVNLLSNFTTVKAFLPDMIAKNKGHIITVASTASFVGVGGMVDYCSTKAGVLSFHEGKCHLRHQTNSIKPLIFYLGLNQELKHKYAAPNVLTTSIHPNWVRTPLIKCWEKELKAAGSPLIEPQDVADAILSQIVSAEGGQVFLPKIARNTSLIRGLPNWLQEFVRAQPSKIVLDSAKPDS